MTLTQQDLDQRGRLQRRRRLLRSAERRVNNIQAAATLIEQADGPEKTIGRRAAKCKAGAGG